MIAEVPINRQWAFLDDLRQTGDCGNFLIPAARPADDVVRNLVMTALKGNKGAGWAAKLLEGCEVNELPQTVTAFLGQVYANFPKPADVPPDAAEAAAEPVPPGAEGAPV